MRNLGRVTVVLATLAGASAVTGAFLAGCGGDDTIGNPDASSDGNGNHDTTTDHVGPIDAHLDVISRDTGHDTGDSGTGMDAADAADGLGAPDAIPDSPVFFDVGDAGFDVADVVSDAPFEVSLAQFPTAVNTAYCQRLANCCEADGGTDVDAAVTSSFVASCLGSFGTGSAAGNLNLANTSSPNVTYIAAKAEKCLAQLAATPCGTVSAAQSELNYWTCAAAIQGSLGVGTSGCTSPFDCTDGGYCPTDGGTCAALAGVGDPCSDTVYSTDCTYEGNGTPLVYCNPVAGTDAGAGTCQNDFKNGSACFEYQQCRSQVCEFSPGGACASSFIFADPEYCAVFSP